MVTSFQVTFDCADSERLARFWAGVLGYMLQDPPAGFATWPEFLTARGVPEDEWSAFRVLVDPIDKRARIFFERVPEPKRGKNRLHLDVNVGGDIATPHEDRRRRVDAEVERVVALGASVVGAVEKHGDYWVVLQDPEGNEFCLQYRSASHRELERCPARHR